MRMRDNMLWLLLGNVIYMGCQWGVLVILVKFGGTTMVGQFSFGFAVCAPIFLLAQLRLRAASATDAKLDFEPADYLTLRLLGTSIALLVVGILCWTGALGQGITAVIILIALSKAAESGSDVLYGLSQHEEQMRTIAWSMILRGLLSLIGFTGLLLRTHSLVFAMAGFCLGWTVVFSFYDLPKATHPFRRSVGANSILRFHWPALRQLTMTTFPLGLSAMLMSFAMNAPRYFVEHFRGAAELGIFSALSYLTLTGAVVVNSITEAAVPRFARVVAAGDYVGSKKLFGRLMLITAAFSAVGILAVVAFGRPLVTLVYKAEYAGSTKLLLLLMIGAALSNLASVCNYLLLAGRNMLQHLISLGSLAVLTSCGVCSCSTPLGREWSCCCVPVGLRGSARMVLALCSICNKDVATTGPRTSRAPNTARDDCLTVLDQCSLSPSHLRFGDFAMPIQLVDNLIPRSQNARVQRHFDENVGLYVKKVLPCYEESTHERLDTLEQMLPDGDLSELRLLDIGCGGGVFLDMFLKRFPRATGLGIDLSSGMLKENSFSPRKRWRQADALNLPDDLGAFDVVNIDTVMHHLIDPSSYHATLKQIRRFMITLHRVLMPGGVIMIREIFHEFRGIETLGTRTIFQLSTLHVPAPVESLLKMAGIRTANAGVCFLSRQQWRSLFAQAGFSILAVQEKAWSTQPYKRYGFAASGDVHYVIGRTRPKIF